MEVLRYMNKERLDYLKGLPLLFTPLRNSTYTVDGKLTNIQHSEEELIGFLTCKGNIVHIGSNFGHKYRDEAAAAKAAKNKVVRKKKVRPIKKRRLQGLGSDLNSQITFDVLGEHCRQPPTIPDKHSRHAVPQPDGTEKITKEYKIKLFRNGKINVPGVLTEDLSDVRGPLEELCRYLSDLIVEDVRLTGLRTVMRNYKFMLKQGRIDMHGLAKYGSNYFNNFILIDPADIERYLLEPDFEGVRYAPRTHHWNVAVSRNAGHEMLTAHPSGEPRGMLTPWKVNGRAFRTFLINSTRPKITHVNFDDFMNYLNTEELSAHYAAFRAFIGSIRKQYYVVLPDEVLLKILGYQLHDCFERIQHYCSNADANFCSYMKYDEENFPGFIIKIKTPTQRNPNKLTTVKIFSGGKVDIDGANSLEEAQYIYYWINEFFYSNDWLILPTGIVVPEVDSEFSEGEEGEDFAPHSDTL